MRRTALLIILAVIVAACGAPADELTADEPTADATAPAPAPDSDDGSGSDAAAPSAGSARFAYSYSAGDSYTFAFDMVQDIVLSIEAEGDAAFFDASDAPPNEVEAQVTIAGTVSYTVAPGPDPDTHLLNITGTFDEVTVTGTIDGEPIEDQFDLAEAGAPDLVQVPDLTLLIDSQGNVLETELDGEEFPDLNMFADPFSSFANITSGGLTSHFGPAFPDEMLKVGSTWGDSFSEDVMDQTITTETNYTVTGFEDVEGVETAVIDIASSFSGVTIDLGDFFSMLFQGFAELGEELGAEGEATEVSIPEDLGLDFLITLEPSDTSGTAWFDPEAGITRKYTQDTAVAMTMDFAIDDGTQKGSVLMDMSFGITLDVVLVTDSA